MVEFGFGPILGPLFTLGPQQNWAQGPPIAPTDHGLQTAAHGVWPVDHRTSKTQDGQKMAIDHKIIKNHQNPKKAQKAIKINIHQDSSGKKPHPKKHFGGLFEAISMDNGDKTPWRKFFKISFGLSLSQ
ncbi:hypothetical protein O181_129244 [Austropuccinia psidii MF-1]|uniref:Uncharacterized protein n=1 Tax=Austropuccinia psidii MF-1 TaxID=1389203 RepID=A0A9Q3KYQ2_9BASI|nr:hypothetical protein [Austropuccinia psidii MF-1]